MRRPRWTPGLRFALLLFSGTRGAKRVIPPARSLRVRFIWVTVARILQGILSNFYMLEFKALC